MKNANSTFISSSFGLSWLRTSLNVAAFACASLLVITSLADAGGAQGARVRRGNVSFSQDGNRLIVRASNGAIIEYDRLSIEAGQIMQFIQPSSSSRVLNRVTGSQLTRIDGTLLSNGIVYLVNPQGFRIGNGAVINVGGFFAAAGAMSNRDFVAGRNRFTNLVGEVTNEGLIQAKSVALVGQYVANRGTIDVGDGYVAMGAGDKVFIQDGTGPVVVTVSRSQMGADGSGAGTKAAISNTGTIDAGEGSVTMANGDFYSLAMDLSGTIVGKSIAARGGKGGVLAVNGTLDASSSTGKGGTIDIFGDRVGLFGDALVNANGATGGGSVRIGGDYLGSNAANAPQASRTFIGDNARVTANATQSGDGGRVIVWSNEYTGFFGTIEASAAASGKGGFVETSSHDNLQAFGSVDASSALGQAGTWLLDPSDVVISAGSAGSLSAGVFDPVGTPASIGVDEINAALDAGTSVIINTASAASGAGNITMTGAISKTAGSDATLTLNAVGTIVLSQSISSTTGSLSVALNAGGSVTMESVINTNGGTLTIVAGGAVTQGAGSVLTIGDTTSVTTGNAAITLEGAGTNNFVGAVTLTNTGAFDVSVSSNTALTLGAVSAGRNFSATTASSINVTNTINTLAEANGGTVTLNGGTGLTIGALGDITSDGAVNLTSAAGISTAGDVTTTNDVVNYNSATTLTDNVLVNTGAGIGDINFASTLDGAHTLGLTAGTGSITFTGAVGDTITLASLTVVSAGDISIGNAIKVTGAVSITASTGVDIFIGTAGAGLSLTDAEIDFITEAGSLAITATGAGASITVNDVTGGGVVSGVTTLASNADGVFFMTTASTFNNSLAVVADDVAIDAALGVTGIISFTGNSGVNVIVGTGGVSTNLILSNAELDLLTASGGLNITATGAGATLNVNGVTGGGTISGTTTLTGSNGVTFSGSTSSFDSALIIASIATIESVGVTSTAGGIEFSNSLTLTGRGTSTITSSGSIDDDIAILGAVIATGDNLEALVVNAGAGEISFGANIGSSTERLSALTLTAANTSFAGDVFVFGDLDVGNITLNGATTLETNGLLTLGVITGDGFALQLVADALEITGGITSVSILTIRNVALDGDISIEGLSTFDISQSEWDLIQSSVNSVVLGSLVNTGAITVAGPWINNRAVTVDFLSGGAGEFNIDGTISGTGSLTVHGSGNSTHINADMTQASFNILDSVVVEGGVTRTLTATEVGGIVIDSTGFIDGISADVALTNLVLQTTFVPVLPADPTAPITLTGTFTTVGGVALNDLTIGGLGVDAGTITLSASGAIAGNLSIDLAAGINLNSNAGTLTAASMFFGEDTTLTGATILVATAGDIDFGADPETATLSGAFEITLTASGNATFTDLITLTGAAGSFAFTGNNLTLNGVGTNAIGSTMTVTNTGLFTTYNGGLAPTGADLVVGSDFVQNGAGLNSIGGNITSTNDGISFATGVTLTNNVTMTSGLLAGDDISFATAIRSDESGTRDLTLTAGLGDIALNDGTSTTTLLDAILINSARNVVVGDAITATSFIQLAGTGSTTFQGALSFTGELTVNAGTSVGNTITFTSTVGSVTASSVSLNTLASSARATPATVATIVSGGNIAFSSGTFDMGLNQKLTGLGNITIGGLLPATNATTVTLGDVNAVGNLRVNSDAINLRARASGPIVTNTGGTITDPMVDYIVGGRVFFSVAPVMVGSGGRAVFANTSGNIDANGTLGGFVTSIYQSPITVALLTGAGGQILDLSVANTVALLNPANIIPPQMSILPPIGVLGSSEELEQNEKKKAKPETQGSKKTASETPKTAPGIPVALR